MPDKDYPSVAVVGFGYIGCVIGSVLADQGCRVIGIDRDSRILRTIKAGNSPFEEPGLEALLKKARNANLLILTPDIDRAAEADVVLITVGTPLEENGQADISAVLNVAEGLASVLSHQTVILKSTLPPGATQNQILPVLRAQSPALKVAFCPERLAEGQALQDIKKIPVVVGGVDGLSTEAAAKFFEDVLSLDVIRVNSPTAAELSKLADNLWIDLNIALANEIAQVSDALGVDALEVISAANSLPKGMHNVNILYPSLGVGGYCLTKDPWFFQSTGTQFGLDLKTPVTSRKINDAMPAYSAKTIKDYLEGQQGNLANAKVAVLGLAFKSDTGDCRYTPVADFLCELRQYGIRYRAVDPLAVERDAHEVAGADNVGTLWDVIQDADVVAYCTGHQQFRETLLTEVAARAKDGALIFDGRMYFSPDEIKQIKALGLVYKGVGR